MLIVLPIQDHERTPVAAGLQAGAAPGPAPGQNGPPVTERRPVPRSHPSTRSFRPAQPRPRGIPPHRGSRRRGCDAIYLPWDAGGALENRCGGGGARADPPRPPVRVPSSAPCREEGPGAAQTRRHACRAPAPGQGGSTRGCHAAGGTRKARRTPVPAFPGRPGRAARTAATRRGSRYRSRFRTAMAAVRAARPARPPTHPLPAGRDPPPPARPGYRRPSAARTGRAPARARLTVCSCSSARARGGRQRRSSAAAARSSNSPGAAISGLRVPAHAAGPAAEPARAPPLTPTCDATSGPPGHVIRPHAGSGVPTAAGRERGASRRAALRASSWPGGAGRSKRCRGAAPATARVCNTRWP